MRSDRVRRSRSHVGPCISSSTLTKATPHSSSGSDRVRATCASSTHSQQQPKRTRSGSDRKASRSFSGWPWPCTRSRITSISRGRRSGCKSSCSPHSRRLLGSQATGLWSRRRGVVGTATTNGSQRSGSSYLVSASRLDPVEPVTEPSAGNASRSLSPRTFLSSELTRSGGIF